jgi:hypothetical protein
LGWTPAQKTLVVEALADKINELRSAVGEEVCELLEGTTEQQKAMPEEDHSVEVGEILSRLLHLHRR